MLIGAHVYPAGGPAKAVQRGVDRGCRAQFIEEIPGARAFRVDAGHDAIVARPDRAVPVLVDACRAAAS